MYFRKYLGKAEIPTFHLVIVLEFYFALRNSNKYDLNLMFNVIMMPNNYNSVSLSYILNLLN